MRGKKGYCTLVLLMLFVMIVNYALPLASDDKILIRIPDAVSFGIEEFNGLVYLLSSFFYLFPLLFGIINCILFLCNVCKNYKYALCSILAPFIIYFLRIFIFFNNGHHTKLSYGIILGPILSITSLVVVFLIYKKEEKIIENNSENKLKTNTPIEECDQDTGCLVQDEVKNELKK